MIFSIIVSNRLLDKILQWLIVFSALTPVTVTLATNLSGLLRTKWFRTVELPLGYFSK